MFFKQPDLTSGSRPILQQDETLLFVQNSVGLYEGKYKITGCQNGHAYLTSHRAVYIDDVDPRNNSLAIDLNDVEKHEYQAGFLRSSAKVIFHPKPLKRGFGSQGQSSPAIPSIQRLQSNSSPVSRTGSPFRPPVPVVAAPTYIGNWTCPICSFNNPVPSNFDPANADFSLPPCLTCGIKPPFPVVLKAAIAANTDRTASTLNPQTASMPSSRTKPGEFDSQSVTSSICSRCTFDNHPSLQYCEICGAPLHRAQALNDNRDRNMTSRTQSPGPEVSTLNLNDNEGENIVKFSFRAGGDKIFSERLKNAMIQRKWLLAKAPPVPRPLDNLRTTDASSSPGSSSPERASTPRPGGVGIAGLEARGLQSRRLNEVVLGTAFEDLEALMASARDIVALAEKFSVESRSIPGGDTALDPLLSESAAALGMVATKDMLSDTTNKLYISELARNLAEYITDPKRAILSKQGGIMSLVDLWATFNRSQNGVELVSPSDFHKAADMWAALGLPVRLRRFKSGLLVVQTSDRNDEKTITQLTRWLEAFKLETIDRGPWDQAAFGRGVTAQDAAQRFGWSLGVATEELEMAEESGALCREEGVEGLKFWLNGFVGDDLQV